VSEASDPKPARGRGKKRRSNSASRGQTESVDALLEGIGEGFFALSADWRFTAFNRAAEEIFGLSRANVIGRVLWEVSPRILGTEFERRYRRVMSERVREAFEAYSALRPECFHEVRAFPFGDGVGVAFRDITDRRKVTEDLREREAELARVQRIGGIGGVDVDLVDGFRTRRTPEYLHLHGLPASAANETYADWTKRIHPEDRHWVESYFLESIATEAQQYKCEYRIVRPSDGEIRWIRSVAEIERDETGRALRIVGAHLDVTDRKQAEQAAWQSEERLRAITDALPLLISYVDRDEVFRFANKPYEIWFGRALSEIVGHHVGEVMDPAMYEFRRPFIDRALAGETVIYEADFVRSSATVRTEVMHVPNRDEAGRIGGIYTVVQDITARKLSEKNLSESEERFRSIANSAPVPMWVSRLDGSREFVNGAYRDFLGVPLADALAFDWRKALHPEDLARILSEQKQGEGSRRPFTLEARYLRADGQWRWLRSESQPRWGPDGDHIGFIGVAHDLTSSKEAEQKLTEINEILEWRIQERSQQLAATEALIRTFFNHSSECHAVLVEQETGEFRYEEVNPATLRLYGKQREQVIGRTTGEVFGAEFAAEIDGHLALCLRKGAPYRYERAQGESIIEAVATPVPREPDEPRRVVVSARDVTERRLLEQQLQQSQKMEAVGQLTGGVAHDFNNLLTLVLGGLDIIGRQIPALPASAALTRIEAGREMALKGVSRAVSLTRRLLAFSRQQSLAPRSLDANALMTGLYELLSRTLGETILLETHLADDLWTAFADAHQLESAILNLALNARDAMPEGGRLTIQTVNATLDDAYVASLDEPIEAGHYVMIAVADNGHGMDRKTRERAFDPFFTTKEVGKGTGLGLSQVYGFARQSAGHVNIYSELGYGTTVRLYLPRRLMEAAETTPQKAADVTRLIGEETILLVEDDEALKDYATEILRELGYHVLQASSAGPALKILADHPEIDLLLTDMVMPGRVDGRQLADRALSQRPGLKVLFMTGYTRNAIGQHGGFDAGMCVISKPFSFEELAVKVREQLDASIDPGGE